MKKPETLRELLDYLSTPDVPVSTTYVTADTDGTILHSISIAWGAGDGEIPPIVGTGASVEDAVIAVSEAFILRVSAYGATVARLREMLDTFDGNAAYTGDTVRLDA